MGAVTPRLPTYVPAAAAWPSIQLAAVADDVQMLVVGPQRYVTKATGKAFGILAKGLEVEARLPLADNKLVLVSSSAAVAAGIGRWVWVGAGCRRSKSHKGLPIAEWLRPAVLEMWFIPWDVTVVYYDVCP